MNKKLRLNALLVEILIAILFFALSAAVILDVFSATHVISTKADEINRTLTYSENLADRLYASCYSASLLEEEGFVEENGVLTLEKESCLITVTHNEHSTAAGTLHEAEIHVSRAGETLFTLPCSRYISAAESQSTTLQR